MIQFEVKVWGGTKKSKVFYLSFRKNYLGITVFSSLRTSCRDIFRKLQMLTLP